MRTDRLSFWMAFVAFACVAAAPAFAQDDMATTPVWADSESADDPSEMISPAGEVAADPMTCMAFGEFADLHAGRNRYRGNVFRVEEDGVELLEIKAELRFRGTVDLHFSIHQAYPACEPPTYIRYMNDVVVSAEGDGQAALYTTGPLPVPLELEPGYNYAIGAAWTETDSTSYPDVTYGNDELLYPVPFLHGQVLGAVALNSPPPLDDDLGQLFIYNSDVYAMELCFTPVQGACCFSGFGGRGCDEVLETDCVGAGSYFFGERVRCSEVSCDFGACCFPCGQCGADYTAEACAEEGGSKHWSGVACLADPELPDALCPEITGACCTGDVCEEVCLDDCDGVYRGDGTTCDPNVCVGACCIWDACLELTETVCEDFFYGTYKGDGTECMTLHPEDECGGACCFSVGQNEYCQDVSKRSECTLAYGVPNPIYIGAGTVCWDDPCAMLGECSDNSTTPCGEDQDCLGYCDYYYWVRCTTDQDCVDAEAGTACLDYAGDTCEFSLGSCCLPDGTCLYTTQEACIAEVPGGGDFVLDAGGTGPDVCLGNPCDANTGACCLSDGTCEILTVSSCPGLGGVSLGAGIQCDPILCTAELPQGACCGGMTYEDCTTDMTELDCLSDDGLWQGEGTNCDVPEDTCPGFGACCWPDGTCEEQTSAYCVERDGEYLGHGITCAECPDDRGACCTEFGGCLFVLESQCLAVTENPDAFKGVGEPCSENVCPSGGCCENGDCWDKGVDFCDGAYQSDGKRCSELPPDVCKIGACCLDDGSCIEYVASQCTADEGRFDGESTCDPNPCEPIGACCFRDGICGDDLTATQCVADENGRLYPGEACTDIEGECIPVGACCYPDATCQNDVLETDCEDDQGILAADACCWSITCESRGACCSDGVCFEDNTPAECEFLGGVYQEDGSLCYAGRCTLGACCHLDGTCQNDAVRSECSEAYDRFFEGARCENVCLYGQGACCFFEDEQPVCDVTTYGECMALEGEYDGNGKLCRENLCEQVTCCFEGPECLETWTRQGCERGSGVYMGADATCETSADPMCSRGTCCASDGTCTPNQVSIQCEHPDDFSLNDCVLCTPRGACCTPDDVGEEYCRILRLTECLSQPNATYVGDATTCEPEDLCVYGACCMPDGGCQTRTRLQCELAGGVYEGAFVDCLSVDCTRGACCELTCNCFDNTVVSQCAAPGAVFGAGLSCGEEDFTCQPRGACCEGNVCTIKTRAQCELDGGEYMGTGAPCDPNPCRPGAIIGSDPLDCAIDARQPSKPDGTEVAGWNAVDVTFDGDASGLTPEDFTVRVEPGPATVPVISAVVPTAAPETITLQLDNPIPTGHWTCFTYNYGGPDVCLGYLPGDVSGDRTSAPLDILKVIDYINGAATSPWGIYSEDIDRSGVLAPPDILRVIDLLNGAGAYDPWLNVSIPACPTPQ